MHTHLIIHMCTYKKSSNYGFSVEFFFLELFCIGYRFKIPELHVFLSEASRPFGQAFERNRPQHD